MLHFKNFNRYLHRLFRYDDSDVGGQTPGTGIGDNDNATDGDDGVGGDAGGSNDAIDAALNDYFDAIDAAAANIGVDNALNDYFGQLDIATDKIRGIIAQTPKFRVGAVFSSFFDTLLSTGNPLKAAYAGLSNAVRQGVGTLRAKADIAEALRSVGVPADEAIAAVNEVVSSDAGRGIIAVGLQSGGGGTDAGNWRTLVGDYTLSPTGGTGAVDTNAGFWTGTSTETTTSSADPWGGDEKLFWNEFMNSWFGLPATEDSPGTPSYRDRMKEDFEFVRDAGNDYIDTMSGYTEYRQQMAERATNDYVRALQRLQNNEDGYLNPIKVNFGGNSFSLTPKRGIAAIGQLGELAKDKYTGMLTGIEAYATPGERLAGLTLNNAQNNAPNAADLSYIDKLMEQTNTLNALRYGLPTTTTTQSESPSLLEKINAGISTGKSILDIIEAWNPIGDDSATNASIDDALNDFFDF